MITSSTKRRLRKVGMFVTFLALAITVFQMYLTHDARTAAPSRLESDNVFNNSRGINKVRINAQSGNVDDAKRELNDALRSIPHDKIYTKDEAGSGIYIHRISQNDIDLFTDAISRKANIHSQTVMADTSLINFDEEAVKVNLASKERQYNHLSQLAIRTDIQNRTMNQLFNEMLDLRQKLDSYKNIDKVLLYTIVTTSVSQSSPLSMVKRFVLSFLRHLGILFISTVMIYYGAKLLMFLLKLMGIKDLGTLTGYGYGSYGGYKNYSGRYSGYSYGSRRKVKRVYKNKPTSDSSESDEEGNNS